MTQPPSPLTMLLSRHTRRREFITLLGGAAVVWPLAAGAQKSSKVYRIGVLEQTSVALHDASFEAFRQGLRELGYVEGQNLAIEYRSVDDRVERYPELAAQLVGLNVDLIITRGTPAVLAARNATATIPVVMAAGDLYFQGVYRCRGIDLLWGELQGPVPPSRCLRRQNIQRCKTGRFAGQAADQVRAGHQS
jgi:hypothetical protein